MHSGVQHFSIALMNHMEFETAGPCFADLARMPHLTSLDLRFNCPMSDIEIVACPFFSSRSELEEIILAPFQLTPKIVESLSRLPKLRTALHITTKKTRKDFSRRWRQAPSLH